MKNDTTTTFLNFVLAAFVILGVLFALFSIWRIRDQRRIQNQVQVQLQRVQIESIRVQALLNDTVAFNATAKSPELAQIIQSAQAAAPAAK